MLSNVTYLSIFGYIFLLHVTNWEWLTGLLMKMLWSMTLFIVDINKYRKCGVSQGILVTSSIKCDMLEYILYDESQYFVKK